jgi:hypothetical protein
MSHHEQATRQFVLGISKLEQGYLEGKYRNKDEQDFASKNDYEWYTSLAYERDLATHQTGQMATDRVSRVNCRIAELRYNLNFDLEEWAWRGIYNHANKITWLITSVNNVCEVAIQSVKAVRGEHNE